MSESLRRAWAAAETLDPVDGCQILLPAAARWDHPSWITDRASMLETGVRILRLLTAAVIRQPPSGSPVHEQLASTWNVRKDGARLIRAALVLSADHEFNASAFAADEERLPEGRAAHPLTAPWVRPETRKRCSTLPGLIRPSGM